MSAPAPPEHVCNGTLLTNCRRMQPKSKCNDALVETGLAEAIMMRALVRLNTSVRTDEGQEVLTLLREQLGPKLRPASTIADEFFEEHAMQAVQSSYAVLQH